MRRLRRAVALAGGAAAGVVLTGVWLLTRMIEALELGEADLGGVEFTAAGQAGQVLRPLPVGEPEPPCCDFRDHATEVCFCDQHTRSTTHPNGILIDA